VLKIIFFLVKLCFENWAATPSVFNHYFKELSVFLKPLVPQNAERVGVQSHDLPLAWYFISAKQINK
jgi:hypothetical protein